MASIFQDKNILVTGGTGSIGREIVRKVLQYKPNVVRVFNNDETELFNMEQELGNYPNIRFLVGDVRDKERLQRAVEGIDFVFHAAALKHVPLCEYNPFEAVKTNVLGTQNLIEAAMEEEVEKLITISTDKAVNPVNVMGATKLLAERLTVSANYYRGTRRTVFSCVRFGNVLDSRGSVVPLFREQIKRGGPVTITDPDMTRFVMSIPRAVDLVLKAAEIARGGEIFIFKMRALHIRDLAEVMIEELAPHYGYAPESVRIEISGKRAGEKLYEELLTEDEALNVSETGDMFVVTAAKNRERKSLSPKKYRSDKDAVFLTKEEIRGMLKNNLPQDL
jgi:UDP-N-acetylglucosamine 4,6-dehydratase